MIKDAKNRFFDSIKSNNNPETTAFDNKFLKKAVEAKGMTTGQIEYNPEPAWARIPAPTQKLPVKLSLGQRIKSLWSGLTGQ